ncbi:chemotaxis protein [Psychroserpens burtonensis]|uniref:Chemotaxis protein n=1 Tax=Psychroserpens burtonensis TaxID=49278 RepID=A0A5C7B7I5_9FLAO|nr:MCP four helix bundle domain-containing protein [Psychroserpens burtonensis]TXE16074.1 chemotaxis protein [Psychroserpens burtonensis]
MAFFNKVKWILGILIVFVLIVTTNLIDKNNFIRVRDAVVTIYEDRVVASDLIFDLSKSVQEKEIAAALLDTTFFYNRSEQLDKNILELLSRYDQTKLTKKEKKTLNNLKSDFEDLKVSENILINSNFIEKRSFFNTISDIQENLYNLSKIQLSEGKRQMSISKKAVDKLEIFTQIEIYLLALLAIVIQIIILYKPKQRQETE